MTDAPTQASPVLHLAQAASTFLKTPNDRTQDSRKHWNIQSECKLIMCDCSVSDWLLSYVSKVARVWFQLTEYISKHGLKLLHQSTEAGKHHTIHLTTGILPSFFLNVLPAGGFVHIRTLPYLGSSASSMYVLVSQWPVFPCLCIICWKLSTNPAIFPAYCHPG